MTRRKVKLAFIVDDAARKATFRKRKKGLVKKVSELSTLCGVEACAVIYSPFDAQSEVWPSPQGAQEVLSKFKEMPGLEKSKKMMNQETLLRERMNKVADQLNKLRRENHEKEIKQFMYQCMGGRPLAGTSMADLHRLNWVIERERKEVVNRIKELQQQQAGSAQLEVGSSSVADGSREHARREDGVGVPFPVTNAPGTVHTADATATATATVPSTQFPDFTSLLFHP